MDKVIDFEKELETFDLINVPIFSTGTWEGKGTKPGGDKITTSFLNELVETFKKIGSKVKPRMILSHDGKLSEKISGLPAIGWITALRTNGEKLFVDIKEVPKKIYELIKKKAYGRFSPGIFDFINLDGKKYNNVLDHVALLGAALPADTDVDAFIDMYYENNFNENLTIYDKEVKTMSDNENKINENKILEFENKIKTQDTELKSLEKENKDLKDSFKLKEYENRKKDIDVFLTEKLKEGKVLPSQIAMYTAIALEENAKIIECEYIENNEKKQIRGTGFDIIKTIIDNNPKLVEFSESTHYKEIEKSKDEDDLLDKKIKTYMKENNDVTYAEAFEKVTYEQAVNK